MLPYHGEARLGKSGDIAKRAERGLLYSFAPSTDSGGNKPGRSTTKQALEHLQ